jgi:hypothetical protein
MLLNILLSIFYFANGSMVTKIDNQFIDPNYEQIITSSFNSSTFNLTSFNITTSLKKNKYEIASFVSSLNKMSHPPIVFLNQRENSFLKDLIQILHEDYDATSIYFSAVNEDLYDFSESSKSYCLTTIASMKQHGGFSFKDEKKERDKEREREKEKERGEKEKTDKKEVVKNKGGAFLFAAAAAFVTGDIITPVSVFLDDDNSDLTERNDSYKDLTKDLTKDLDLVFDYSQIYCINTFSLFFAFKSKEQSLTIYGDKINYEYFVNFFNGLQENIKTKNLSSVFMENIIEQLEVLKMVASKLEQLVVFELHDKLTSLIKEGSSVSKIQKYISKKVSELVDLKQILVKDFPILKANYKEEARLNAVKREINALKHTDTLLNSRQDSDQKVTKDVLQNELNGNEFEAFANLYVYGPLKRTTKLITRAIIVLPEGVAVGGLQGIYDFLGSISTIFFGNPVTTGFIIIGGLAVIYSSVSNIFHVAYNFVSWIFFPFFKGTKVPL